MSGRLIEPELTDRQARQFALAESGQDHGLVDEGSLSAECLKPLPSLETQIRDGLPLPLAAVHGHGIEDRPAPGNIEQPAQFVSGHGASLAAAVRLLIGLRDALE